MTCGNEACTTVFKAGDGDGMFCSTKCSERHMYATALPCFVSKEKAA